MFCVTEFSHHYIGCNADKSGSYYTIQKPVTQAKASNGNVDSKTQMHQYIWKHHIAE